MEAELDQVDGRPIIGPELHLECPIARNQSSMRRPRAAKIFQTMEPPRREIGHQASGGQGVAITADPESHCKSDWFGVQLAPRAPLRGRCVARPRKALLGCCYGG